MASAMEFLDEQEDEEERLELMEELVEEERINEVEEVGNGELETKLATPPSTRANGRHEVGVGTELAIEVSKLAKQMQSMQATMLSMQSFMTNQGSASHIQGRDGSGDMSFNGEGYVGFQEEVQAMGYQQRDRGALNGTHVNVKVPMSEKPKYRNRKGDISTNVLGVSSQDMQFIYVLPEWEGSATDGRVLRDAIRRTDGLRVPHEEQLQNEEGDYNLDGNASAENVDNASNNNVDIQFVSKSSKRSQSQTESSSTSKKQRKSKSSGDLAEALTESTATLAAVIEKSSTRLSKAIGEDLNEKHM
ncbi:hypothetical protein LWI29_003611 [Acer saccharum]|uniref:DDE Tnp4 domain-containing protein n=1 Tax=Acer saccharum TaxID=4024 RepID=A0AA39T0R1_ACESA|nr:hypothetical protein LWI29_003611 [Acer saccharum]